MATTNKVDYDQGIFDDAVDRCDGLRSDRQAYNSLCDKLEKIYLLDWDEKGSITKANRNAKITISPNPRNKVLGANRLLSTTEPQFSVQRDANNSDAQEQAEKLEQAANKLWTINSRLHQYPLHNEAALSLLLFGEAQIMISDTASILEHAKKGDNKASQIRAQELADTTPYLFDVVDPRTGYPEIDGHGMSAYHQQVDVTGGYILDTFGDAAGDIVQANQRKDTFKLDTYFDHAYRIHWIDGHSKPIYFEEHGLGFIPAVVQTGEGGRLFDEPENQRQGILWGVQKTDLWKRENLYLTLVSTIQFAMTSALFYFKSQNGRSLTIDYDGILGGVVNLMAGEEFGSIAKQLIDPGLTQLFHEVRGLIDESTIYGQTLGQPIGGSNDNYSLTALLHQAGRLPLAVPQLTLGWLVAGAVKKALRWIRVDKRKAKVGNDMDYIEITPAEIPGAFDLNCNMEISLPQDKISAAKVAATLRSEDNPLVSDEFILEDILGVQQPKAMAKTVRDELASKWLFRDYILGLQLAAKQKEQALTQPAQAPMQAQGMPMAPANMTQPGAMPGAAPGQGGMMPAGMEMTPAEGEPNAGYGAIPR